MFHPQLKNDPYFRKALYTVYGGKCAYCGDLIDKAGNLHVDHIYAENARTAADPELQAYLAELRAGGFPVENPDVIENYLPACQHCNRQKSNWNFTAQNLRYYHNLALNHTPDILKKLEQYRGKAPGDLDDFRVENMAIRCLTALPPRADTSNVICRERELADVRKLLREGRDVLLMSGFGGIGKTSLARLVFYTVLDEYDEAAWVPYRGSLRDSMIGTFLLPETYRTPADRWARILEYSRDGLKKLIVVDNADHIGRQDPQTDPELEALSRWPDTAAIVTSRLDELRPYQKKEIGFLSPEACVELFYLYYPNDPERKQRAAVEKLVELAQYHSLTVELFARGAKRKADLENYYQTLSKDLRTATRQFTTVHTGKMGTIEAHLRGLFIVQDRTDDEKRTLWSFAVLPPNAALTVEEAEKWFDLAESELDPLAEDGWLLWKDDRYAMHPLLRQIIRLDEAPEGTAEHFLAFLEDKNNGYFPDDEVYTERIRRLELADAVLNAVCKDWDTVQVAHILHNLGRVCWRLARYDNALKYHEKALVIEEAKLGKEHLDTASTYNSLAGVYRDIGDLSRALGYLEKAQIVFEKELGTEHPDMATVYNNLANVYYSMCNLPKALAYLEKALAIREKTPEKEHSDTATIYNDLALLYKIMGDLPKALEYNEKALAIEEKVLGREHPNTATTYNNLALVYQAMGDLPRALEYNEKALAIRKKVLGKEHPLTAITNWNMGALHYKMKKYPDAIDFLLRALRVFLVKLGPEHPHTRDTYSWLPVTYQAQNGETESFLPWLRGELNAEEKRALDELLGA